MKFVKFNMSTENFVADDLAHFDLSCKLGPEFLEQAPSFRRLLVVDIAMSHGLVTFIAVFLLFSSFT